VKIQTKASLLKFGKLNVLLQNTGTPLDVVPVLDGLQCPGYLDAPEIRLN
jgi:hypothetical protein